MPSHFLKVCSFPEKRLDQVLDSAQRFETCFKERSLPHVLAGKRIALSFEDGGFRNRVAFELGAKLLGAEVTYVPWHPRQKEAATDVIRYLENWFDALVIRTPEFSVVEEMASISRIPVINARTRHNHPCEIIGDLAFFQKLRGSLKGLKMVFVGEPTNLCYSWLEAAAALPIEVVQICPPGYEADQGIRNDLRRSAVGTLRVSHDLESEVRDAGILYTDCWPERRTSEDAAAVSRQFNPYQIDDRILDLTPEDCLFLPCPPVTRGEEVSDGAMTSPKCRVYEAKDYLLHAQNALLESLLGFAVE